MARSKPTKTQQPLTTAQRLGSLLKTARDIMRKDKDLNGDLDRLPMLTWIMFLKLRSLGSAPFGLSSPSIFRMGRRFPLHPAWW
jgi:hypothetical protein